MPDLAPMFNDRRKSKNPKTTKVYGLFHGGYSYAHPELNQAEEFASIKHAKQTMADRASGRDRRFPAVDEGAEMHLYKGNPADMRDPYPDRIIRRGKRGAWRAEPT